jgi:site-specific DNA-methyltransferase (adenine-specific)
VKPTCVTIGDATLYFGDALIVLMTIDPIGAAALLSDPPYCSGGFTEAAKRNAKGQGLRSETLRDVKWFGGDNMTTKGLEWLLRSTAVEFKFHASSERSTLTYFVDWRMIPALAPAIESAGLRFQAMPIWNKGVAGLGTGFRAQLEALLHFSIDVPGYHSAKYGNVLYSGRVNSKGREHETQKPLELMGQLVEVVSPVGGIILDPFMGSGSTGVASIRSGRKFVGIEHDPDHFETACRRIREAHGDPALRARPLEAML